MPAIQKRGGRPPTRFNPDLATKIMDEVAEGPTLKQVCSKPGYPHPTTFRKWIREDEELFKQWQAVKVLRAHSLFDEAIDLAKSLVYKDLAGINMEGGRMATQNQIKAVSLVVETLRDAAGKLNPQDYSQRRAGDVVVPIQIVTNMNMGQEGQPTKDGTANVYEITLPAQKVIDVIADSDEG